MSISEKIINAKKTNWVSKGIPETEVKTIVEQAKISAQTKMIINKQEFSTTKNVSK